MNSDLVSRFPGFTDEDLKTQQLEKNRRMEEIKNRDIQKS